MENFVDNLILFSASVLAIWAVGFFIVAYNASKTGVVAHEENRRVSDGDILAALKGSIDGDDGIAESRTNYGIAINIKSGELVAQGRLSEEATDEVLGAKV